MLKSLRNISRIIIGIVFIFSGFVKVIDPLGSTYKFSDYFTAFQMEWLDPAALVFAVLLAAIEFAIGFALLNNVLPRLISLLMFIFMSFFTILTLYLAIDNPVSDCGCFGDAITLTNWETFYKNLVLMLPATVVLWQRNKFSPRIGKISQIMILAVGLIISLYLSKNSYNHLPLIDFRAYNIGTNISLAMNEDLNGAPQPAFETKIIYKKDGEQKAFTTDNLPDSTWQWVETKSTQTREGYQSPVQNFNLTNADKQDVTTNVLNDDRFTLMIVSYDIDEIPAEIIDQLHTINDVGKANNYQTFIATASNPEDINQFENNNSFYTNIYYVDPITLKTIVRSNPGLVFMHRGLV